jgi:hypothetical protein
MRNKYLRACEFCKYCYNSENTAPYQISAFSNELNVYKNPLCVKKGINTKLTDICVQYECKIL